MYSGTRPRDNSNTQHTLSKKSTIVTDGDELDHEKRRSNSAPAYGTAARDNSVLEA